MRNPFAVGAIGAVMRVAFPWLLSLLLVCMIGCALSLVLRYRSARGTPRLQLKWLASAAGVAAAMYLATSVAGMPYVFSATAPTWIEVRNVVGPLSFLLIPLAIGVAMLRHRPYDIDVVVNRVLVYGALTSALTLAYVALVTVLQTLLRLVRGGPIWRSPAPPCSSPQPSSRSGRASRPSSTASSTAAGTTPSRRSRRSVSGCAVTTTRTRCTPRHGHRAPDHAAVARVAVARPRPPRPTLTRTRAAPTVRANAVRAHRSACRTACAAASARLLSCNVDRMALTWCSTVR